MLVGERTIQAMAEAFMGSAGLTLPERLMAVLEEGQSAGGDKRGRQSAAMLVYKTQEFPYLSLRVDEHAHPVAELRRVFEVARLQLLPFVDGMPTRQQSTGRSSQGRHRHADDASSVQAWRRRLGSIGGLNSASQGLVTSPCGEREEFGASRNSQAAATAVHHVSITAARST